MVSVTSASRYITSASGYRPRYQSRSLMYIRGLIPRNFAELAEAVPICLLHERSFDNGFALDLSIISSFENGCAKIFMQE